MSALAEPLVDIGVNLTSKQFREDLPQVIERALSAGVRYMIITGLSAPLSSAALELARTRPSALCCTAGVHPHNAREFTDHEPAYLPHVLASVARFAGREAAELRRETTATAFRLFGLNARFA